LASHAHWQRPARKPQSELVLRRADEQRAPSGRWGPTSVFRSGLPYEPTTVPGMGADRKSTLTGSRGLLAARSIVPRVRRLPWLLAWVAILPLAVLRAGTLSETDTFWQVRTGLLIIGQRAIPQVDTFSWTAGGEPWTLNSWGFDVIVAASYRVAGLAGVATTCAILVVATAGMVLLLARRMHAAPAATACVILLASPLLIAWLSARPQLVDYVCVLVLVLLLGLIIDERAPWMSVLGVGLLSFVWVNLHATALLGVAIVGTCAVFLLASRTTRVAGYRCLAATAAAMLGSLANPYGIGLFTQTAQVKNASLGVVAEWQHLDPSSPTQVAMLAIGVAELAIATRRRDLLTSAALTVATMGSIMAIRMLPILVLLALPVLAATASHPAVLRYARRMRLILVPGAAFGLLSLTALAAPAINHIGRPDPERYPVEVVRDIPRDCHLFNSYILGGFVILKRPDVSVSIDSRNDLYGAQQVLAAERALRGEGDLDKVLARAGCVLIPPTSGLAKRLYTDPRWRLQSSAPGGVLFLRTQPEQAGPAPVS
jgi:hypothetical protein